MNKPKQKGTNRETNLLEAVKLVWPRAERSPAGEESRDYTNTGEWVVEAKFRKKWSLFAWIRKIRKVAGPDGLWVIFIKHGDTRTSEGKEVGRVAVFDEDTAIRLLSLYESLYADKKNA